MPLPSIRKEFRGEPPDLAQVARLRARHRRPERAGRKLQAPRDGVVVEVAVQPVANQPSIPGLEDAPGPDADVALTRIRELRKGIRLGGLSIRELIDEGRR